MSKTLCDWSKKDIERDFDQLVAITKDANYICRKCARSAVASKYLCKPRRVKSGIMASQEREATVTLSSLS